MSTIEHTASDSFGKISLGRRISELMQEKGDAFSIRAFAERVGMNRETFRKTLLGERPITLSLVERISAGFGITEERLRQLDTLKKEQEVTSLLSATKKTKTMMLHAQTLARELVDVALGSTERCLCWTNLGRSQFHLQQYDLAHDSWVTAMHYAEKVYETFEDSTLLYHVTSYLMLSFTIRKEYTNIAQTLNVVESAFSDDPEKMGFVHYTRMKWNEHRGNLELAREHAYTALKYFQQTHHRPQIGRAQVNVAHFEHLLGNDQKAKETLLIAIENLKSNDFDYLVAVKDFIKVLLHLNDPCTACELLEANIDRAKEYPDIAAMFRIMYSIALGDPTHAKLVSEDVSMSPWIRKMACKSLMDYYAAKDDPVSLLCYYKRVVALNKGRSTFLEEDF